MNLKRLSTNPHQIDRAELDNKIALLLKSPSNFETKEDGRIFIKSLNKYYNSGNSIKVQIVDKDGLILSSFKSIRGCAAYLGITPQLAKTRIISQEAVLFNNNNVYIRQAED